MRHLQNIYRLLVFLFVFFIVAMLFTPGFSTYASLVSSDIITTIAGTGSGGYSGDGGPATAAKIKQPESIDIDSSGNIYIADRSNHRIRKIDTSGNISTIAGTGVSGYSGDGGPAVDATLGFPKSITVDSNGNVYFYDGFAIRVRKIDTAGNISTYAGNGTAVYAGDDGPAVDASIKSGEDLAVDSSGNLYIADSSNNRVRKVDTGGTITTFAGTGISDDDGDGGPASSARIGFPIGLAVDSDDNIYIATNINSLIRKVDTSGIINTVVGDGSFTFSEGAAPLATGFEFVNDVAVDVEGNIFISDNYQVRKFTSGGTVTTVAGTGNVSSAGDGGAAIDADFNWPDSIEVDSSGNMYIGDISNHRIRKITAVTPATPPAAPAAPAPAPGPSVASTAQGGPNAYRPESKVLSPVKGDRVGGIVEIKYETSDQNDFGTKDERERLGFGENPASLFYANTNTPKERKLIAKDLVKEGIFKWDASEVSDGNYRIIVSATDNVGETGEKESGVFSLDNSAPLFTVTAEPPFSQGEDVELTITSSEKLSAIPEISVHQKSYADIKIDVEGADDEFTAVYRVVSGYDGPATVSVTGIDIAGNTGSMIVGGGTFSVGIEPPSKPIITIPLDKDVFDSKTIRVEGSAREDTEIILVVNGVDEYKTKPDSKGEFAFKSVSVNPNFNRGINFLNIISRDVAGNISEAANLSVKFNVDPNITIIAPKAKQLISSDFAIEVTADDLNNDDLLYTFEVSNDGGVSWVTLVEDVVGGEYIWDTTQFSDGTYRLRVMVKDGFSETSAVSSVFTVRNFTPEIVFSGPSKVVSNSADIVIGGFVNSPDRPGRARIANIEYSIDDGATWARALPLDGAFNSFNEKFEIQFNDLAEGIYTLQVRANDERTIFGNNRMTIIIDFGPPDTPVVSSPRTGLVVSDKDDENKSLAGNQVLIEGKAEALSDVLIRVGEFNFSRQADENGDFSVEATIRMHGLNQLQVFATDAAGNVSPAASLSVNYNNPPSLSFINPRDGRGLGDGSLVRWRASDPDLDPIQNLTLSYRRGSGAFVKLVENPTGNSFEFDTSRLPAGKNYQLKLNATDGITPASKVVDFIIDNGDPTIAVSPLIRSIFTRTFKLVASGRARDDFSGVEFVEFSVVPSEDPVEPRHWFKAIIASGYLSNNATFDINQQFDLEDGQYTLRVRSVDAAGNTSKPVAREITIDTTSPRIGSYIISKGTLALLPDNNFFSVTSGAEMDFTVSLETDTKNAIVSILDQSFELKKNLSNGLWEAKLIIPTDIDSYKLLVTAEDEVGNISNSKAIGLIKVIEAGSVSAGDDARITAFVLNEDTQRFVKWQSESYGEPNPTTNKEDGSYDLLLPRGTYQLVVQKTGFSRLRSSQFTLDRTQFVNFNFELKKREGLRGVIEDILESINILN